MNNLALTAEEVLAWHEKNSAAWSSFSLSTPEPCPSPATSPRPKLPANFSSTSLP